MYGRRSALGAGLGGVALALLVAGCGRPAGMIFEPRGTELVWPSPPDPPRMRYVGQLASSEDLKPAKKPLQELGELLVGKPAPETLYGPRAVVCSADGRHVWVADPGGRCVHVLDLEGRVYQQVRQAGAAPMLSPVGLCRGPEESVYVCDSEATAVHRFDAATATWRESLRLPEELERPVDAWYDAATDELFVLDSARHDIKVLGRDGQLLRILGRRGGGPGEFNYPCALAVREGVLWVADAGNHRVQAVGRDGVPVATFGQVGDASGDLALPKGIALDSDGHVYVVDGRFENVQVFDPRGRLLLVFGEEGTDAGEFWLPSGIHVDARDRVWVCDTYNNRIQVFDYLKRAPAEDGEPASDDESTGAAGSGT